LATTAAGTAFSRATAASTSAFRGDDQLQQAFGVFEKFFGLLGVEAEGACCKLRGHGGFRDRRIGRDEADFVHMNVGIALERGFELFRQLAGL
jgi:hypothetical protein